MRAGRLIAEEGLDYASAKRQAAREIVGAGRVSAEWLPANDEVEQEVRLYQGLFQADTQPARLRQLRSLAADLMRWLAAFRPHLIGAVVNGTASEHSAIHIELYTDSAKEVEIFLLNRGVDFDVVELPSTWHPTRMRESIRFEWRSDRNAQSEGVELIVHDTDDLRGALNRERGLERADLARLEALIAQGEQAS
jgi:hypothetical protein